VFSLLGVYTLNPDSINLGEAQPAVKVEEPSETIEGRQDDSDLNPLLSVEQLRQGARIW
jgi:hypothetical protein